MIEVLKWCDFQLKELSPSSIYIRGKGCLQHICGLMPLQGAYNNHMYSHTCGALHSKCTHVKIQGESSTRKPPKVRVHSSKVQHYSKCSNAPMNLLSHMPPLGTRHVHVFCGNLGVPEMTSSLHTKIQATPCYLGLDSLL